MTNVLRRAVSIKAGSAGEETWRRQSARNAVTGASLGYRFLERKENEPPAFRLRRERQATIENVKNQRRQCRADVLEEIPAVECFLHKEMRQAERDHAIVYHAELFRAVFLGPDHREPGYLEKSPPFLYAMAVVVLPKSVIKHSVTFPQTAHSQQ